MSELLNLVGLGTGIVLYAVLLLMVVRAGGQRRAHHIDPLIVAASLLGLVWNLCALPIYEFPRVGIDGPFPGLAAVGFSALGFLPAVVVHSVLRRSDGRLRSLSRLIACLAYAMSLAAGLLHIWAWGHGRSVPSVAGMQLLTLTFVVVVVPVAGLTRGQPGARRALWVAALAAFAVSALHLTALHKGDAAWPIELLGHHASLPLVLAILYQDYPFAFADLFLKRALALLAIVSVVFVAIVVFASRSTAFAALSPRQVGLLVTVWVATCLLYPRLRQGTTWFVDAIVLRRPHYATLRAEVVGGLQAQHDIAGMLTSTCQWLASALGASDIRWDEVVTGDSALWPSAVTVTGTQATVYVHASDLPRFRVHVGDLTGGRRFLSDDIAMLEAIAIGMARRIDAIRLTRERFDRAMREQEISKLATEAELRALRAQISPHFLFNALTTIGYLIQTAPPRAFETLMRLTTLLRAVFRSEGEYTTLGREMDVVEAYLDIERARFEHRLRVTIDVSPEVRGVHVPPLILQPLVENAVKHGIAPREAGGHITINARIEGEGNGQAARLLLSVVDTGRGVGTDTLRLGIERGVGIRNVERRLFCHYGAEASLSIRSVEGRGTTVDIQLPLMVPDTIESIAVAVGQ